MQPKHGIVHAGAGQFNGWPANHGMWAWDEEVLVRFTNGYFRSDAGFHDIDPRRSRGSLYARSFDGGKSWAIEHAGDPFARETTPEPSAGGIDFTHPDFAMRIRNGQWCVSTDRGREWSPRYELPDFGTGEQLTARTDYIVKDAATCLIFLSIEEPERETDEEIDRSLCAAIVDGGAAVEFRGWITEDPDQRSIMPATTQLADGTLLTIIRQTDFHGAFDEYDKRENYLEAFRSTDDGRTWTSVGRIADTHNPAAAVTLGDDSVVVAYGYRTEPYGIRGRITTDCGETWSEEFVLRDDGRSADLGYPRMVARPDGTLLVVYYFTTVERKEQHIAATIFDPATT